LALKLATAGADPDAIQCIGGPEAYQELLSNTSVDAIYIPLPSALHKAWVTKALEAGKHVLLEKPVALKAEDFCEMMQVAFRCGKLLLDGTMFVHTRRTDLLLQHCTDSEKVGDITRIEGAFSFNGKEANPNFFTNNIRCQKGGDPMGCVGDLGWYCVYMAVLVFRTTSSARPIACKVMDFTCTDEGVPIDASCLVYFEQVRD
jgi:predicted dehydrogenase